MVPDCTRSICGCHWCAGTLLPSVSSPRFSLSFTLLVWLIDGSTGNPGGGAASRLRAAFVIGWLFGFSYFVANLWWLGNALLVDAEEFAWALPLAVFRAARLSRNLLRLGDGARRAFWSDGIGRLAALAAAFGVAEWLRSFVLTHRLSLECSSL